MHIAVGEPVSRDRQQLDSIGRDHKLEAAIGIMGAAPTDAQWRELVDTLSRAAEALGVGPHLPARPEFVLAVGLYKEQREALDRAFIPRYSAAIEQDELPRDSMVVSECGERMVPLREGAAARGVLVAWSERPFAAACGEWAGRPRIFWARAEVAERFFSAAQALNAIGLLPMVEDGYRPPAVQAGLFRRRVEEVRKSNPGLFAEEVLREARAKTACAPYRAAHMGGAAIDFTLRDSKGQPLDLGNPYPTGGAAAILNFPYVTWEQFRTRQIFASVSRMAGLVPYAGEDWHVSHGDGLAAVARGEHLIKYGPLKDFDRADGTVVPYDAGELRVPFPY